jgi:hydroxymethylbilane synthase
VELLLIKTTGDKILDVPLSKGRRQGAVRQGNRGSPAGRSGRSGRAHMKDVPVALPEELVIAA